MFICRVALGNQMEVRNTDGNLHNKIGNYGSAKAIGQRYPPNSQTHQNSKIFTGSMTTENSAPYGYNEYIVFNPNQVELVYLFVLS